MTQPNSHRNVDMVSGILLRSQRRASKLPTPSILLVNVESLENKMDDLLLRVSHQPDIKNGNILCFTETWLNKDMDNIELAGYSTHRQNRHATSGKMRGGGVCRFVNNSWCAMSKIKEVSSYCSPEVEYLMISCRPHYLPREFSSVLFIAVYLPPQSEAGTKTALKQLHKTISKEENAHPEAALLVAGDFNAGKHKSVYMYTTFTPHIEMHTKLSLALQLANLTIILSSRFLLTKTTAGSTSDSLSTEVVR